jgi:hypothetical protein
MEGKFMQRTLRGKWTADISHGELIRQGNDQTSATSGGTIELRVDGPNGPVVGRCTVSGTGGWQTWADVSCPVSGATGTRDLYLNFTGGGGFLFNVDWWRFAV